MNKVVIFDWGGIVESHENDSKDIKNALIRIIRRLNKDITDEEVLAKWCYQTSKGISIGTTNDIDEIKDWVNLIQKQMNINVSFDDFKRIYQEEFSYVKYYRDVVQFAHSLKGKCKIAILSNLISFDKERINKQYDLSKFDYVYLSFEVGMEKPNKDIYEYVLNDLKVKPEQILFIDDDTSNIQMAKKYGWNTCQAYGYELDKIKESVNNFLNEV